MACACAGMRLLLAFTCDVAELNIHAGSPLRAASGQGAGRDDVARAAGGVTKAAKTLFLSGFKQCVGDVGLATFAAMQEGWIHWKLLQMHTV